MNRPAFFSRPEEISWPRELQIAVENYPRISPSRSHETRFWSELEGRKRHARTPRGRFEQFCQVEIGGLAVWRIAGATLAGSAPTVAAILLGIWSAPASRDIAPRPILPFTPLALSQIERTREKARPFKQQHFGLSLDLWLAGKTRWEAKNALA